MSLAGVAAVWFVAAVVAAATTDVVVGLAVALDVAAALWLGTLHPSRSNSLPVASKESTVLPESSCNVDRALLEDEAGVEMMSVGQRRGEAEYCRRLSAQLRLRGCLNVDWRHCSGDRLRSAWILGALIPSSLFMSLAEAAAVATVKPPPPGGF